MSRRSFAAFLGAIFCAVAVTRPAAQGELQAIQSQDDVEGTLEVRIEDSAAGPRVLHFLHTGTRTYKLRFPGRAPAYSSGHRVRARGRLTGADLDTLELSSDGLNLTTLALASANTFGEQRVALILVNFQDNPTVPYSAATASAMTFQTTSDFYRQNTYGQTWLTGAVFGWYTLPMNASVCDPDQIAIKAEQAATAQGVNLSQYTRRVYAFPQNACGWWGLGSVGGSPSKAWINGSFALKVVAHELGHNFGSYHSHSMSCDAGGCSSSEYGDDRDVMGNPYSGHLTAFQKERLGWLNYGSSPGIQTVTASGTYFIDALETPGGTKALKILKGTESNGARTYYYVEARWQQGFDSETPGGVIVHRGTENSGDSSYEVNLTPTTSAWDSLLDPNQTFTDGVAGISIRTVSAGAAGATVTITTGTQPCTKRAPTLTMSPTGTVTAQAGQSVSYSLSALNNDDATCGSSTFTWQPSVPSGWTGGVTPGSATIAPGATAGATFSVTIPVSASGTATIGVALNRGSDPGASASRSVGVTPYSCGTRRAPTVSLTPGASTTERPGATSAFTVIVVNNDDAPCGATTFALTAAVPAGWSGQFTPASISMAGGGSASADLSVVSPATASGINGFVVTATRTNSSGPNAQVSGTVAVAGARGFNRSPDIDGDAASDVAVYRPSNGQWFVRQSSHGFSISEWIGFQWGYAGDQPITGDFDGDGKTDVTVYRPTTGEWFIRYSSSAFGVGGLYGLFQWGLPGDVPIVGDFDGDGRTDLTVYRPSTGYWFVRYSSTGYSIPAYGLFQWGLPGDVPLSTDFDGDGRTDLVVYRPTTGDWYVRTSGTNYNVAQYSLYQWGLPGDTPLSTDFDGDGRTDIAVYRPATGEWYIRYSTLSYGVAGQYGLFQWGLPGDVPVTLDLDADGKTELAVYRPATGEWVVRFSTKAYSIPLHGVYQWGLTGDLPLPIR